jgi:hypothetical protein
VDAPEPAACLDNWLALPLSPIPSTVAELPHESNTPRRLCRRAGRGRRSVRHCPGPGNQGRHRHVRLDRLCAADAGQGSRPVQEARPGRQIKKIPQKDRHLAIASGDIQCAATTVETWIVWNANGVATTQIFQLDKSYGADGMVVKPGITKIADLKGKTVAASARARRRTSRWPGC